MPDLGADFCKAVVQINIGGDDRTGSMRIFAQSLGNSVLDITHAGSFQLAVDIDADYSCIAQNNTASSLYTGHPLNELFQMGLLIKLILVTGVLSRRFIAWCGALSPRVVVRLTLGRG